MNMELRELVAKWVRQSLATLLASRRAPHSPSPPRRGGLPLGMLAPDDMTVIVRRRDAHETVPHLGAAELFLGSLARDLSLEHHVAVVGRADDAPAVLGQVIQDPGDLGQPLRLLGDVLPQPG